MESVASIRFWLLHHMSYQKHCELPGCQPLAVKSCVEKGLQHKIQTGCGS